MKKKIFTSIVLVLVVVVMSVALVACGTPTKDNTKFIIGATGPLTGPNAIYGVAVKNAANLAIDEINANGGLNGVDFQLEMMDDVGDPEKSTAAYSSLYDAGMNISLGSVTTAACTAFAQQADKDKVFFITPSASGDDAVLGSSAYRVCFGDPDQGEKAANWFKDADFQAAHPDLKIGIIYKNDDGYSNGIYQAFENNKGDLDVVVSSYNKDTNTDFSNAISQMKNAGCNVLLLPIYYQEATLIITEANKQNYKPTVFGCDGLDGIESYAEDADLDVTGVNYFTPFDANSSDESVKTFVDAYKTKYNEVPNQFAADAYDAVYIIYNLMKKGEIDDPTMAPSDISDILNTLMDDFTYDGVTGKSMSWDDNGHCHKEIQVVTIG